MHWLENSWTLVTISVVLVRTLFRTTFCRFNKFVHKHVDTNRAPSILFSHIVLSRRTKADRLAVWVRDKDNVEAINGIGYVLVQCLRCCPENIYWKRQSCFSLSHTL